MTTWLEKLNLKWHDARCELRLSDGQPIKEQSHTCAQQGFFTALGDICPACQGPWTYRAAQCDCGLFADLLKAAWPVPHDEPLRCDWLMGIDRWRRCRLPPGHKGDHDVTKRLDRAHGGPNTW